MRGKSPVTLTQLLHQFWSALIHETSMSEQTFAAHVREHYERLVPEHVGSIEWSNHPDIATRMHRDAEKINRWFNESVRANFPVDAVEAFVAAFPDDRRWELQMAMADRQGLMAVPKIQGGVSADSENLGRIGKETGEAMIKIAQLLDDNCIDENDAERADDAIEEIDQAIAVFVEMRERIKKQAIEPARIRRVK